MAAEGNPRHLVPLKEIKMFRKIARLGSSTLQHGALLTINIAVGTLIVGLIALTLMEQFRDTPQIRDLSCFVGIMRTDCPAYGEELKRLKSQNEVIKAQNREMLLQRDRIEEQRDQIESRMAGLQAIERSVDQVTLFEHVDDPNSELEVIIGTVYSSFTVEHPKPERYFCYINLPNSATGLSQFLDVRNINGWVSISRAKLRSAGVRQRTVDYAKSVCEPYLIGQAS